jgi:Predicted hydrolases or acyltransferases (alpha/beta hydrolase superfamily)
MSLATRVLPPTFAALSVVAPPLAAELALPLWAYPGRREAVHPRDAAVHARAVHGTIDVDGIPVATSTWGDGPEVIVLVHGWRSRASRFGTLVAALESADRTIVAFDAPGHGDTLGRGTTALQLARIIRRLVARHGGATAIVGHSFGVLASFIAVREGVPVDRIVGLAGVHDADHVVDGFARDLRLGRRAHRRFRTLIERRFFPGVPDIWRRAVAELDPVDTRTQVLLVHDPADPYIPYSQSEEIRDAHTGPVRLLPAEGVGHTRILSDPAVAATVAQFLAGPVDSRPLDTGVARTLGG